MRFNAETLTGSQGSPQRRGLVSGFVWKLIRESLSLTQIQMAEALGADIATIQGWETGRRPLTATRVGDLAQLRIQLIRRGASPRLFDVLRDAIEADLVIEYALQSGPRITNARWHPLAATVHRRDLTNLISWPFTGVLPGQLNGLVSRDQPRRGPAANRPSVSAEERGRFFDHLLAAADHHRDLADSLLRRQATYLLHFDSSSDTAAWVAGEHRRALKRANSADDVPSWVTVRSAALALATYGHQDPLIGFIETALDSDAQALANINYWVYWIGEISETYVDDTFMRVNDPKTTGSGRLLEHLVGRLDHDHVQVELYVHTLWQLLLIQPDVLARFPALRRRARTGIAEMDATNLTARSRQKISDINYALRLSS